MPPASSPDRTDIDRIAPTRRPAETPVMYQKWRRLSFIHWAFPPESIQPLLPKGVQIDTFGGLAYVGLVPFTMSGVRPRGLPAVPWLSNFHETNVRTYVLAGNQPGVWFFSLEAANPIAVALARRFFGLPYHNARMKLESGLVPEPDGRAPGGTVQYRSTRLGPHARGHRAACRVTCRVDTGPTHHAAPGSLEHFLIERYLLFTNLRGQLYSGQVNHSPYPIQNTEVLECEENLLMHAGVSGAVGGPIAHFSAGVDVEIFRLKRVTSGGHRAAIDPSPLNP